MKPPQWFKRLTFSLVGLTLWPYCRVRRHQVPSFVTAVSRVRNQGCRHRRSAATGAESQQTLASASTSSHAHFHASNDLSISLSNGVRIPILRNYVFVNVEPLGVEEWSSDTRWFEAIRGAQEVWSYTEVSRPYIEELGVRYVYLPMGYAPSTKRTSRPASIIATAGRRRSVRGRPQRTPTPTRRGSGDDGCQPPNRRSLSASTVLISIGSWHGRRSSRDPSVY